MKNILYPMVSTLASTMLISLPINFQSVANYYIPKSVLNITMTANPTINYRSVLHLCIKKGTSKIDMKVSNAYVSIPVTFQWKASKKFEFLVVPMQAF